MSRSSAAVLLLALPAASGLVPTSLRPPAQTASRAGWCGLCQAPQAPPRGSTGDAESDAEVARRRAEYLESLTPEERQKRQVGLAKRLSADISGQRRDVIKRKGKRTERKTAAAGRGFGVQRSLKYDRRPKPSAPCGCGSDQSYADCCLPQHESGVCTDPEPAALVRARCAPVEAAYRSPSPSLHSGGRVLSCTPLYSAASLAFAARAPRRIRTWFPHAPDEGACVRAANPAPGQRRTREKTVEKGERATTGRAHTAGTRRTCTAFPTF